MRILLTGIPPVLHEALTRDLARQHEIVTLDGDVRDRDTCARAADCDVVIHGIPAHPDPLMMLDEASRGTWNLLTTTSARRYVLLSTMRLYDAYGPGWHITESWAPFPTTNHRVLAPYLAEIAAREVTRSRPIETVVLRLDDIVTGEQFEAGDVAPECLHIDDAVSAINRAIDIDGISTDGARWVAYNIVRGDPSGLYPEGRAHREPFGFAPAHRVANAPAGQRPVPTWPPVVAPIGAIERPDRVVIFGAGGPLGAVTTRALAGEHQLRVTDIRSLREIAASPPQSEGAPLPEPELPAPHEEWIVDVTDPDAVLEASAGMDAIVVCTVMRHDPVQAFRVNTLGAWNIMQAAVEHGIRRVVHTGPVQTLGAHPAGYNEDIDVPADAPPRPGDNLYFISKHLGQEICRVFAEEHGIACPNLLFSGFVDPEVAARRDSAPGPFTVSWDDAGRAMAGAVHVARLDAPYMVVHVMDDGPDRRFRNDSVRRVLGWEPQDRLDRLWYRRR